MHECTVKITPCLQNTCHFSSVMLLRYGKVTVCSFFQVCLTYTNTCNSILFSKFQDQKTTWWWYDVHVNTSTRWKSVLHAQIHVMVFSKFQDHIFLRSINSIFYTKKGWNLLGQFGIFCMPKFHAESRHFVCIVVRIWRVAKWCLKKKNCLHLQSQ